MSNPTNTVGWLRKMITGLPGRVESYAWAESIDLSAAAGALACITGSLKDADKVGTDAFRLRKGYGVPEIIGIMGIDASGGGADGYLQIQGRARKIRFGKISKVAANGFWAYIPNKPIQVPEGSQLDLVGNKSGAGAEIHAVVIYVHYPKYEKPKMVYDYPAQYGPLGLKTGTRVASTLGPWTAYPLTGFEDSELAFASDPKLRFAIEQVINGPSLSTSALFALRWPNVEKDQYEIIMPTSLGADEVVFDLPPIVFTADNPVKLAAWGTATTSDEYGFVISTNVGYGDTDAPVSGDSGSKPTEPTQYSNTGGLSGTLVNTKELNKLSSGTKLTVFKTLGTL